jgi:hypothetical protein
LPGFLHGGKDRALGEIDVAHRLPGHGGGRQHLRLDHLGLGIADGIDAAHPAVPDVAQDRTDGGGARD